MVRAESLGGSHSSRLSSYAIPRGQVHQLSRFGGLCQGVGGGEPEHRSHALGRMAGEVGMDKLVVPCRFLPLLLFLLPPSPYRAGDEGMHRPGPGGRRRGGVRGLGMGPRENQSAPSCPPSVRGRYRRKFFRVLSKWVLPLRIAKEISVRLGFCLPSFWMPWDGLP